MRLLTCALVLAGSFCADSALEKAFAQIRRFPYRATVEGDNVYVRSGPGRSYYPTSKLKSGARVTVHRHDPGGWYMIAPPKGSFSWIRANHVEKTGAGQGVLTRSNVIVRVGSEFGDSRDIEQVRLSKGASVAILGESDGQSLKGNVKWYKIASPRGEYRWISGRNIVPVGESARRQNDTNPYAIPSNARRDQEPHRHVSLKGTRPHGNGGPRLSGPSLGGGHQQRPHLRDGEGTSFDISHHERRIEQLDARFRVMVKRNPRFWDLTEFETGYEQIRNGCSHAAINRKVAMRMAAVKHYQNVKADYEDIIQLTSETSATETRLARVQRRLAARAQLGSAAPVTPIENDEPMQPSRLPDGRATSVPQPALLPTPRAPLPGMSNQGVHTRQMQHGPTLGTPAPRRPVRLAPPVPNAPVQYAPTPNRAVPGYGPNGNTTSYPVQQNQNPQQRYPAQQRFPVQQRYPAQQTSPPRQQVNAMRPRQFDGAGVIRRVVARTPNMPQHALVAPNGRILAYLQPVPGLPLDQYVGRPMGVYGNRSHRQDLRNDFIVVRAMMPVRLQP